MRMTQVIGLTEEASQFLKDNCAKTPLSTCPTCNHTSGGEQIKRVYSKSDDGMFDDGPDLWEYTLNDGKKVREVVQASPWSSGPCIFLCLEEDGKRLFEWLSDDMEVII